MYNCYYLDVDTTSRPIDADTFEVFIIKVKAPDFRTVVMDFQDGRPNRGSKRFWIGRRLLTELMLNQTFRERYLSFLNKGFCLNLSCPESEAHVAAVLLSLFEEGVQYMYLRGSEVSLDRLVQLQD